MANYVGTARSNYFAVKDEGAFLAWVETLPGVSARKGTGENAGRFALFAEDGDGWPAWRHAPVSDDTEEPPTLRSELLGHLADGEYPELEHDSRSAPFRIKDEDAFVT